MERGESGGNVQNGNGDLGVDVNVESDTPLAALRPSSTLMLSTLLNPVKVIPSDNGLPRDWRGLAELAGVTSEKISFLHSKADPTSELVQLWCKSEDSRCCNFSDLRAFLSVIDRFDVVDDITPLLVADAENYWIRQRNNATEGPEVQPLNFEHEKNILTIEDSERLHKGLPLTRYDAFLLHSDSEEDSAFASEAINTLESKYGLKLCVKDRDLLPGVMFEHEVIVRLIEERCNRFLVIFSPDFLKSSANQFLVSYAQASALETHNRKIVPCVYKKCELPPSVRFSFCIDYNRSGRLWNFWDKLSQSLSPTALSNSVAQESGNNRVSTTTTSNLTSNDVLARTEKLEESLKWWDADKNTRKLPKALEESTDSGISTPTTEESDSISMPSNAHLLPSPSGSEKSKKWYKKLTNPIKKKRDKDKPHLKQQAIADQVP